MNNFIKKNFLSVIVIILAVVFIFTGILRGENIIVLKKAINICLECIGLG